MPNLLLFHFQKKVESLFCSTYFLFVLQHANQLPWYFCTVVWGRNEFVWHRNNPWVLMVLVLFASAMCQGNLQNLCVSSHAGRHVTVQKYVLREMYGISTPYCKVTCKYQKPRITEFASALPTVMTQCSPRGWNQPRDTTNGDWDHEGLWWCDRGWKLWITVPLIR